MCDFASEITPHLPRLQRYARSLQRDRGRADDLVQDTMVRALEKAHLYRHDTNLRGWLVTIMHNEHVNAARRHVRGPTYVSDETISELGRAETQEAPVELREIRRAVDRLPQGTVQSRISRARKALRAMIAKPDSGLGLAHRPEAHDRSRHAQARAAA